jgi:hypothetical protein
LTIARQTGILNSILPSQNHDVAGPSGINGSRSGTGIAIHVLDLHVFGPNHGLLAKSQPDFKTRGREGKF